MALNNSFLVGRQVVLTHRSRGIHKGRILSFRFQRRQTIVTSIRISPPFTRHLIITVTLQSRSRFAIQHLTLRNVRRFTTMSTSRGIINTGTRTPPRHNRFRHIHQTGRRHHLLSRVTRLFTRYRNLKNQRRSTANTRRSQITSNFTSSHRNTTRNHQTRIRPPHDTSSATLIRRHIRNRRRIRIQRLRTGRS